VGEPPTNLTTLRISRKLAAMRRTEVVSRLQHFASAIRSMGATALYVFGSMARDETRDESDLDLFVDYDPNSKFNAFDLVGIKQFLEDELQMPIDLTTRDGLHPMLRKEIEQSAIRVF
jgi:predicted nucleotidyltransferase